MATYKHPEVLVEIQKLFNATGYYGTSCSKIRAHLLTVLPPDKVPARRTISKILNRVFNLKYKSLDAANLKYRDPTYNQKR